jgi:uncharacterized membrane protein (DUF2068 family)
MSEKQSSDLFLRIIAIFKLVKAVVFIGAGIAALHLLNKDLETLVERVAAGLHVDPDSHLVKWCLEKVSLVTNLKLVSLSAICFCYAILFSIEGTGLYLRKRWAEWFVVIITGSLLPLEGYEIWHRVTVLKILLTAGNIIILGYLIYVIRNKEKT